MSFSLGDVKAHSRLRCHSKARIPSRDYVCVCVCKSEKQTSMKDWRAEEVIDPRDT